MRKQQEIIILLKYQTNVKKNWTGILEMKIICVKTKYSYWDSRWAKQQTRHSLRVSVKWKNERNFPECSTERQRDRIYERNIKQ